MPTVAPITSTDAYIALISNAIALAMTLIVFWKTPRGNTKSDAQLFLRILTVVNIITVVLAMIGVSMAAFTGATNEGRLLYQSATALAGFLLLLLALLDVTILQKFSSLNNRLTGSVLLRMRIFLILFYLILAFIDVPFTFISQYPSFISSWITYGYLLFGVMCVIYDNVQLYWLLMLVYKWKSSTTSKAHTTNFRSAVKMLALGVALDWFAIILDVANILIGKGSGFYVGLSTLVIAMSSIHMNITLMSLATLTSMALSKQQPERNFDTKVDSVNTNKIVY